ncbi:MAG: hypothetical protein C4K47_05430 [Candidatus Thorarchaeota archaeon]|nr:MAG: hypothetical protein C4K47_05430 [Candidatus Thorarchaeota archaeon]
MRITGTQYTVEKKESGIELKNQGRVVETFQFQGKTLSEVADAVWDTLKRKGVVVQRAALKEDLAALFPGSRPSGPLK